MKDYKEYQESLNKFVADSKQIAFNTEWNCKANKKNEDNLQKLIDKQKPMKTFKEDYDRECPSCSTSVGLYHKDYIYCSSCGQLLVRGN